jgi:hypothetical protein
MIEFAKKNTHLCRNITSLKGPLYCNGSSDALTDENNFGYIVKEANKKMDDIEKSIKNIDRARTVFLKNTLILLNRNIKLNKKDPLVSKRYTGETKIKEIKILNKSITKDTGVTEIFKIYDNKIKEYIKGYKEGEPCNYVTDTDTLNKALDEAKNTFINRIKDKILVIKQNIEAGAKAVNDTLTQTDIQNYYNNFLRS